MANDGRAGKQGFKKPRFFRFFKLKIFFALLAKLQTEFWFA